MTGEQVDTAEAPKGAVIQRWPTREKRTPFAESGWEPLGAIETLLTYIAFAAGTVAMVGLVLWWILSTK